jgi:hypothetical protein
MGDTKKKRFVGLADAKGLCRLDHADDAAKETLYNQSLISEDTCYFEMAMSDSEIDILKDIPRSNPAAGLKACIVFGKDDIEVPEEQANLWLSLSKPQST